MFFPKLTRKEASHYLNSKGVFYANYRANYDKVAEDCMHRCIYCDILLVEIGGEGMHLDHFRPQKHFPELSSNPFNLVLSCPKCNYLKSDDWPCGLSKPHLSFEGKLGYIDPFEVNPNDYLDVSENGEIVPRNGPINYMIMRLQLNRKNRCLTRRTRIIEEKEKILEEEIASLLSDITNGISQSLISKTDAISTLEELKGLLDLKLELKII